MKANSVKAYHSVKAEIPDKEREVLHLIKMYGPINGRMLDVRISGAHKRIAKLLEYGCIGEAYMGNDPITGRLTAFYHFLTESPNIPKTIKKNKKALDLGGYYDIIFAQGARYAFESCGFKGMALDEVMAEIEDIQK